MMRKLLHLIVPAVLLGAFFLIKGWIWQLTALFVLAAVFVAIAFLRSKAK